MNKIFLPICIATTILLAGCSTESTNPNVPSTTPSDALISLSGNVLQGNAEQTKAPINGNPAINIPALDLYFARADENVSTNIYDGYGDAAIKATRAAGKGTDLARITWATGSEQYYLVNGLKTKLTAWHPGGATAIDEASGKGFYNATAQQVTWKIDGTQDIMTAPLKEGNKSLSPAIGNMTFSHSLSQVQVYVYAEDASTASAWGKVTDATIREQRDHCSYNLKTSDATGAVTFNGSSIANFKVYENTTGITAPLTKANAALLGTAMIEPHNSSYTLKLSVTTAGGGTQNLSFAGQKYEVSKAYKLYIKLRRNDIEPTVTIGEWTAGGEAEIKPTLSPAIMIYNGTNGTTTTGLQGFTRSSYNGFTGKIDNLTGNGQYYTAASTAFSNEKGYEKLEVALANELTAAGHEAMNWGDARSVCQNRTTNGGGWRLPRLSELKLMYLNKEKLEKTPGFGAFSLAYWVKTENSASNAWYINFETGLEIVHAIVNANVRVRCVREIPHTPAKMSYGDGNNGGIISGNINSSTTITIPGYTTDSYNNHSREDLYTTILQAITAEKAYYRLEVASANELNPNTGSEAMTWFAAKQLCKDKTTDGGGWRLPRLSELMLMGFNRSRLNNTSEFTPFNNNNYWSATIMNINTGTYFPWTIDFTTGYAINKNASGGLNVRCVREL